MHLQDYLRIAARRWLVVAVTVVVAVLAAAALTARVTPQYQSSARVQLNVTPGSATDAYQSGLYSQQRAATYADVVRGRTFAEATARVLGEKDATDVAGRISGFVIPQTVVLQMTATADDPARAQRIADAAVTALTQYVERNERPKTGTAPLLRPSLVDPATYSSVAVLPAWKRKLGLAGFLGLFVGLALAAARELLDRRVHDEHELVRADDARLLAVLPTTRGERGTPVAALPPASPRAEAYRVLRTGLLSGATAGKGSVVVVARCDDGGLGPVAADLAVVCAAAGHRVLLVEGDLADRPLTSVLDLRAEPGTAELLDGRATLDAALQVARPGDGAEVAVLAAGSSPASPADLLDSDRLDRVLDTLREQYDVVVVQAPSAVTHAATGLLARRADATVLVVERGRTRRDDVPLAVGRVHEAGGVVSGLVLDGVPARRRRTGVKRER